MKNVAAQGFLKHDAWQVVGSLYLGSPRVSGPLVGPSWLTAQTAACGALRGPFAGIDDIESGPAWQGHGGLQAANCESAEIGRTQEIHHDQIRTHECLIHKRAGRFLRAPKLAENSRVLPSLLRVLVSFRAPTDTPKQEAA